MYVRWVVRRHKNAAVADMSFHDAYLVESYRDERGSPRQRTICYLGNIRQMSDEFPPIERELFLLRAERILQGIEQLSSDDRANVLAMLHQKVHPLTTPEVLAAFTENLRWYQRWWQKTGEGPTEEELIQLLLQTRESSGPI
jgi:hypothetical protein